MTTAEILRQRLLGQKLVGRGERSAHAVVRHLGAVQAQEYGPTKWSLGMRTRNADGATGPGSLALSDADVEKELNEGRILRTHLLRPTWHFAAVEDIRWMLALTAPRVKAANAFPYKHHGLEKAAFSKSRRVMTRVLAAVPHLSRDALGAALQKGGVDIRPNRLSFLLMDAELEGLIVSGARDGKQHTYALFDQRVPPAADIEPDEALMRLAVTYFGTRGPANAHDFAWWSGLTIADVKRAVQLAGDALERVAIDQRDHWMAAGSRDAAGKRDTAGAENGARVSTPSTDGVPCAHLLPVYDEFFIGLKDRGAIGGRLPAERRGSLAAGVAPQFGFVNGELVARWRRTLVKGKLRIEIEPLTRISAAEKKGLAIQATTFAEFSGLPLELKHGQITK